MQGGGRSWTGYGVLFRQLVVLGTIPDLWQLGEVGAGSTFFGKIEVNFSMEPTSRMVKVWRDVNHKE